MKKKKDLYKLFKKLIYKLFLYLAENISFTKFFIIRFIRYKSINDTKRTLISESWRKDELLTQKNLIDHITKTSNKTETCHIICSGASALETIDLINDDQFVITTNFSGMLLEKSNLHFCELALLKNWEIGKEWINPNVDKVDRFHYLERSQILSKIRNNIKCDLFLWKNIYGGEVSYEAVKTLYKDNGNYLLDYFLPPYYREYKVLNTYFLKLLLDDKGNYLPQFANSVFTYIGLVSKVFKKIILHGFDMGGKYFYESHKFKVPSYLNEDEINLLCRTIIPNDPSNTPLNILYPIIVDLLKDKGVSVYRAKQDMNYI